MTQAKRVFRNSLIEFLTRRAAPLTNKGFVTTKRTQPVAWRRLPCRHSQIGEQVAHGSAAQQRKSRGNRCPLHEMQVAVDKAGGYGSPRQPDEVSPRTD